MLDPNERNQRKMAKIRNEELDQLAGEVLPERTVLSSVPMDPGGSAPLTNFCNQINQGQAQYGNVANGGNNLPQCGFAQQGGKAKAFGIIDVD